MMSGRCAWNAGPRYAHCSLTIQAPAIILDSALSKWERLDVVKIDAEGAEALVWEGMQETLKRFPAVAVAIELYLQRDPPQVTSFLHQLEREGYSIRHLNYDGDIAATDAATIVANPQDHWMLWIQR